MLKFLFKNKEENSVDIDVYDATKGEIFSFRVPKDKPFTYPKIAVFEEYNKVKSFLPQDVKTGKRSKKIVTVYMDVEQEKFLKKYASFYWRNIDMSGEPYCDEKGKVIVPKFGDNLTNRQIEGINTMFSCRDIIINQFNQHQKSKERIRV